MNKLLHTLVLSIVTAVLAPRVCAENNWPQWRGPTLDGASEASGVPATFDKSKNLAWSLRLPGPSAGTPIIWGNRVFVSSLDAATKKLLALCVDRASGKEVWRREVGLGFTSNDRNNMAGPSPLTDGKSVWFYYGTGDLAAFDFEGKPLWTRNLQKDHGNFNFQWIYASSPLFHKGKLYIQVLHRDVPVDGTASGGRAESYLLAIDPGTGKDVWKQVRPSEAKAESQESYGTPVPFHGSPRGELVVVGGDAVTGHDVETGKELWRFGDWNPQRIGHWRLVPSAVTGDGLVFACAPKNGPVMAIKAGGEGEVTKSHQAWRSKAFTSDVCVPLYYRKQLYVLDGDKKRLYCVDPQTGSVKWQGDLGGDAVFRGSPTAADGKIYCVNERGAVWVVAADEFNVLNKVDLGSESSARASVALADGQAFVRTGDTLYCFGSSK